MSALISFVLLLWIAYGASDAVKRRAIVIAASAAAVVAALLTMATRERVEWDQVALRSVTVGADMDGYWGAAFGEDVRFVLVANSGEVSQSDYGRALIAHLAAPIVGSVALVVVAALLIRRQD